MKKGLVPVLRFPEFWDAGEWEIKRLEDICKKISQGGTPDTSIPDYWNGDIEWLTPAEMGKLETRFITTTNRKISKAGLKNCSSDLLPINSVILSSRAPIGHLLINKSEMAINQGCKGLVPLPSTDHNYLYYSLARYRNALADLGAGNTFKELSGSALKNFKLPIPTFPEQQKIADCLASLDELIAAQTQKLDTLKTHKKGLMQQLFPAEGETVPKLRFPEFRDAGEWKEKPLSKISTFIFDGTHQTPTYTEDGIPFFSVENIVSGKLNKFISREDYLTSTSKNKPEKGDVLITRIGNIGFSAIVDWEYEFSIYVTLAVVKKTDQFDSYYLHCFFQSERYQTEIRSKSLLNAVPCKINMDELRKTKVLLPSPTEQQKIADCLSSLDELITAQTQKLATLKAHKKGLMQQLFPAADEVAG